MVPHVLWILFSKRLVWGVLHPWTCCLLPLNYSYHHPHSPYQPAYVTSKPTVLKQGDQEAAALCIGIRLGRPWAFGEK